MILQEVTKRKKQTIQAIIKSGAYCIPKDGAIRHQTRKKLCAQCRLAHATRPSQRHASPPAQHALCLVARRSIANNFAVLWTFGAQRGVQIVQQRLAQMLHSKIKIAIMFGARARQILLVLPNIISLSRAQKLLKDAQFED
jgi:hypothetical protein